MSFKPRMTPQDVVRTVDALVSAGVTMPPSVQDAQAKIAALAVINQMPADPDLRTISVGDLLSHTHRVAAVQSITDPLVNTARVFADKLAGEIIQADVTSELDTIIDAMRPAFDAGAIEVQQVVDAGIAPGDRPAQIVAKSPQALMAYQGLPQRVRQLDRIAQLRIQLAELVHEFGDLRHGEDPPLGALFTDSGAPWAVPGEVPADRWLRYALTGGLRLQSAAQVQAHRWQSWRNRTPSPYTDSSPSIVAAWGDDDDE